jgi:hypothetical protein
LKELVYYNTHHNSPQADFIHLDELLIDLKLNEDALEIPIPRYFKSDFSQNADARNQLLVKDII